MSKALIQEIPKSSWEGDWLINLENDIKFLEKHFLCDVGGYLWIAETHRLKVVKYKEDADILDMENSVWAEYMDGEKRKLSGIYPNELPFLDERKMPPVSMRREACRFILKVREIDVQWLPKDKRTGLVWVVGIERMPDVDIILEQFNRGRLK